MWIASINFNSFPSLRYPVFFLRLTWLSCRISLPQEILAHAEVKGILYERNVSDLPSVVFDFLRTSNATSLEQHSLSRKCPNIRHFPDDGNNSNCKFVCQAKLQLVILLFFFLPSHIMEFKFLLINEVYMLRV